MSTSIPRLGVLWCPHWSAVVAGARPHEPLAVVHANRVVAHTRAAGAEGVAVGQRRREAQARCPHVRLEPFDADRDARAFDRVVQAVGALVPRVEVSQPGLLTFVARGPARYFGGEVAMAGRVLQAAGVPVGVDEHIVGPLGLGVADGRFAAGIAARRSAATGVPEVVPVGAAAEYLRPLPVHLLTEVAGVPAEFVDLLRRLGLHHLGALASLPAVDMQARFGPLGMFAHRIASGGDDRMPGTHDPPVGRHIERLFEPAVQHSDALVFVARQLADELTATLSAEGLVCTRMVVRAETEHGEHSERVWYRSTGLSAPAMVERVRWQLDAWVQHADLTAGVSLLRLDPVEVCADDGVQLGLWGGRTQADDWASRAVARLVALVGEAQVVVPAARGGRHPHEMYEWVPAVAVDPAQSVARVTPADVPWPGSLPSPSPAEVHTPPLPTAVFDQAGHAVSVSGRGAVSAAPVTLDVGGGDGHGARHRSHEVVEAWAGPWPVDERWWDPARARRTARLQVLTRSGRLLLLAVEGGQWWLTAEYR